MRALTTWQPYASLIMAGVKDVENRPRPVPSTLPQWYRCRLCGDRSMPPACYMLGKDPACIAHMAPSLMVSDGPFPFRLGIHAAKKDPDSHPWPRIAYEAIPHGDGLPTGVLLGTVLVTGCHWADECEPRGGLAVDPSSALCSRWAERDRYHITLTDPQPFPEPIPMRGYQGWWTVPEALAVPA